MLGFSLLIVTALWRLSSRTLEAFDMPFGFWHWVVLIANLVFMGYSEGWKGFQKTFSPRFGARTLELQKHPREIDVLLAPFFLMGYYRATRRRIIATWILTISIITLVILIHFVPQPMRGVIDAGVVFGLGWGLLATLYFWARAFFAHRAYADPELPAGEVSTSLTESPKI